MKFFIKDFFSKCDQIRRKLGIWSYYENFIFCAAHTFQWLTEVEQEPLEFIRIIWMQNLAEQSRKKYNKSKEKRLKENNFFSVASVYNITNCINADS